jgi:hypothetical protein
MPVHTIIEGDSLTPLGMVLKQKSGGKLVAANLTDRTVKVEVTDESGTVVIPETTTGVEVVNATAGQISYTFPTDLERGVYLVYARVYGDGDARDTYPSPPPGKPEERMKVFVGGLSASGVSE